MAQHKDEYSLALEAVDRRALSPGVEEILLQTDGGTIQCVYHPVTGTHAAVIWVGGAGGGLDGPARGMYARLALELVPDGIASLRLDYRRPNELTACVLDILMGVNFLESEGCDHIVLVGHSFGGAVVITAGANSDAVVGVVTLSSQNAGTELVADLAPRPLLLIHGQDDRVLPDYISEEIFARAREPKQIKLYPGCSHGLTECVSEVDRDLLAFLRDTLLEK